MVITFANQKGGTGKTTSCFNVASIIAKTKKVLLIDLDPQTNLTYCFSDKINNNKTVFDLFINNASIKETISSINDNIDIIPACYRLNSISTSDNKSESMYSIIPNYIEEIKKNYDYIFFDTRPVLDILTINALLSTDYVFIPLQAEIFAVDGLANLTETIKNITDKVNKKVKYYAFINSYKHNNKMHKGFRDILKENLQDKLLDSTIRNTTYITECVAFKQSIIDYAEKSSGAEDYINLTKEILSKIN